MKRKGHEMQGSDEEDLLMINDEEGDIKRIKSTMILSDEDEEESVDGDRKLEQVVSSEVGGRGGGGLEDENEIHEAYNHRTKMIATSKINTNSVLAALIYRDDLRAFERVLVNSSSKSKGQENLVDVLLLAATSNAVKITEFLLRCDNKSLSRERMEDEEEREEELSFDDRAADSKGISISPASLGSLSRVCAGAVKYISSKSTPSLSLTHSNDCNKPSSILPRSSKPHCLPSTKAQKQRGRLIER